MEVHWKRNLFVLWLGLFFNHLAYTLSVPFFPLFLEKDSKLPILFSNDLAGFEHLEHSIRKLQKMHSMSDVVVGMESIGHYWFNIANRLVEQGIDVALVNPMTTKRNKENRDN
ncbi:IS110 family transposase [Paenibacillus aestuarii]|uniref:Transposase n=1 Tax=Paenibacillus aestuarii TaxID=516965 RepID=A0ABW0KI09_9BACL|nr:transposase [Paenibacillus aestuarii]